MGDLFGRQEYKIIGQIAAKSYNLQACDRLDFRESSSKIWLIFTYFCNKYLMMKSYLKLFPFLLLIAMISCGEKPCEVNPQVANTQLEIEVERLEDKFMDADSPEELERLLNQNMALKEHFLVSGQYPHDSILIKGLWQLKQDPNFDSLYQEVKIRFDNIDEIKQEFELAFKHLRQYYPNVGTPKLQTFISGLFSSELYVSDSVIIVGLDFYLGPGSKFRPRDLPKYILGRYRSEYIVPASMLILSHDYVNEDVSDRSMLADMIYYGKKYYLTKQIMPCTHDSLLIWYTQQQLQDVNENQDIIWANFVQNQLLFDTNHLTKKKFLDERPNIYEIGEKCPGRIGAWLGWEIVNKYMKQQPAVSLQQLMNEPDARKIFNASNYKPAR